MVIRVKMAVVRIPMGISTQLTFAPTTLVLQVATLALTTVKRRLRTKGGGGNINSAFWSIRPW